MAVVYPDDVLKRVRALELGQQQLFTSINTKPAFNRVESGPLVVGRVGTRQITLNPDGALNPEIWLDPDGTGTNPTRVVAESGTGQAVLKLYSGTSGGVQSSLTLDAGQVSMTSGAGSFAYWGHDESRFGYNDSTSGNWFRFGPNICRHNGAWDDFASLGPNTGLLWGSITIGGSSTSATVGYPSVMASNMGPIVSLRNGGGVSMAWCITASSASSYSVAWATSVSVALYQCAFRH
ncbi:hypothetical protein [Microbispora sp. ATCC PTA-5024]|uniref:hypothetical protein n=1 Tax=Microbispora sp. ATCC PTA-5024 TaxID=316330 RepID=UPI0003DBEDAE|nr:hypothetical protein [Microbispora sp. ATCC PTA-5024]ETK36114.1 hypothetical protein MPTA5024_10845 [Microbispora sp. ATCC PTA-5024]